MDILLILLILWAVYTIFNNMKRGAYMFVVYIIASYFALGLIFSGQKKRIFFSIILANLISVGIVVNNVMNILGNLTKVKPVTEESVASTASRI
jgi:hypothetical protein